MAEDMSLTHIPLTIIVAATSRNGIGKNGGLPWPMLKKDMAYFARVTKRVPMPKNTDSLQSDNLKTSILEGTCQNVIIMGRKTWDSIPAKLRPLKDRTSIVITSQARSQLQPIPDNVVVTSDIISGLRSLEELVRAGKALPVGRAFIIGGTSIYKTAMGLPQTNRILMTRVHKDYECDTFFPEVLDDSELSHWRKQTRMALQDYVGEAVEEEGSSSQSVGDEQVGLDFELYERV